MFIVLFTHLKPLAEVDTLLQAHFSFLDDAYAEGVYLLSGRREPRNGAVILARAESRASLEQLLHRDPFISRGAARFDIDEFIPGRAAAGLQDLLQA